MSGTIIVFQPGSNGGCLRRCIARAGGHPRLRGWCAQNGFHNHSIDAPPPYTISRIFFPSTGKVEHAGELGEKIGVVLESPAERFRYWDQTKKDYTVEAGDYELLIGSASDDIRCHVPFKIMAN